MKEKLESTNPHTTRETSPDFFAYENANFSDESTIQSLFKSDFIIPNRNYDRFGLTIDVDVAYKLFGRLFFRQGENLDKVRSLRFLSYFLSFFIVQDWPIGHPLL